MKTSELKGAALDWAVAKCENTLGIKPKRCCDCKHFEERAIQDGASYYCWHPASGGDLNWDTDGEGPWFGYGSPYDAFHKNCPISELTPERYSSEWAQGGPIIEREMHKLFRNVGGTWTAQIKYRIPYYSPTYDADIGADAYVSKAGDTPLIAAMRCYVSSKLGDEVEIPEELL
jgi:Protein of unknown function (DUF2591)